MPIAEISSAAASSVQAPRVEPNVTLPDHSRSVDAAQFDQLFQQAQNEHARLQFTNPIPSVASPGVDAVMQSVGKSSSDYMNTVQVSMKSLANVNLQDPRAFAEITSQLTNVVLQGVQMSTVLGEVTSSKKSLQELFHNQG
jgi:hypothetical protein